MLILPSRTGMRMTLVELLQLIEDKAFKMYQGNNLQLTRNSFALAMPNHANPYTKADFDQMVPWQKMMFCVVKLKDKELKDNETKEFKTADAVYTNMSTTYFEFPDKEKNKVSFYEAVFYPKRTSYFAPPREILEIRQAISEHFRASVVQHLKFANESNTLVSQATKRLNYGTFPEEQVLQVKSFTPY